MPLGKAFSKSIILRDHLIALTESSPQNYIQEVYTFHFKDLLWSSHIINGSSPAIFMTARSSLAKPGLIVDFTETNLSCLIFRLLTFETEEGPKNFAVTAKELKSSVLAPLRYFSFHPYQAGIYLFAGEKRSYHYDQRLKSFHEKYSKSNTLYRIDIESLSVSELYAGEKIPCGRSGHRTSLWNDQLYVFGGKGEGENALSDLWVLNLYPLYNTSILKLKAEMRWKQFDYKGLIPVFKNPFWIVAQDQLILLYDGDNSVFSYSFNEKYWEIFSPRTPPDYSYSPEFLIYRESTFIHHSKPSSLFSTGINPLYSIEIKGNMGQQNGKQLERLMHQLCEEKTNADVIFNVENEEIPANKCILSLRSPHFKNAFSSNMMESHSLTIPIKDVKATVFKAMLRWIYFSEVGLNSEIAEDLFKLAHEYRLEELKNDCEKYLLKEISIENSIKNVQLAERYEAPHLRRACIVFIVQNIDKFFQTQEIKELDNQAILEICKLKI